MNQPIPNVLVVDDEPNNFDVIETFLSEQDYQLYYASSGDSALSILETVKPDLILLDVMMPGIDGMEVCQRIKAMPEWESVPIIMVTALTSKEDLARCLNAGADDFIGKPVNSTELRARVNSMMRIKQQYDSIKNLSNLQSQTIDVLQNSLKELSGNLASSLPHELNTPLNGIVGAIGILLEEYETMPPEEIKEFLLLAQESSTRLEKLTRKFLTYVYLELSPYKSPSSRASQIQREKGSDAKFITNIAHDQAKREKRSTDLLCDLDEAIVAVSNQDMRSILCELLENAFKFSKVGTEVKLSSKVVNNHLHLAISDHGWGMTEDQISKIGAFMQFERKMHEQQGSGLGLKIVTKIVENYGGKFSISSIYRQETTVNLELPLIE
ncbi:hybrid sensor histidine kinase/response regulator [Pseudanabaena yagii]|uniref:histidine kinase n=1 Tax=Pseudanabaena yagii GIHE-NHR1 TaxID=2722753 RepID=A0ABX1M421_9CYAN|nr:hybrid sensor histidine kinase/response regulator [Pseudanabaena yagii]NMF60807.1 response regulator [Pseudanabaena yagii GIHE-NHR1]